MEAYLQFRNVLHKWIGTAAVIGGYDLFNLDRRPSVFNLIAIATGVAAPFLYLYTIYTCDGDLRFSAIAYFGAGIQASIGIGIMANIHYDITSQCVSSHSKFGAELRKVYFPCHT